MRIRKLALASVVLVLLTSIAGVIGCRPKEVVRIKKVPQKVDRKQVIREAAEEFINAAPAEGERKNYAIVPEALKAKLETASEEIYLLDVRAKSDFAAGHISGSVNTPYRDTVKKENLEFLTKGKTIVVVCYSGNTAAQVTTIYNMLGYDAVALKGGFKQGWELAGYEVVTD